MKKMDVSEATSLFGPTLARLAINLLEPDIDPADLLFSDPSTAWSRVAFS